VQERKDLASKLKAAGNKSYGSKDYNKAIDLYTKAILLRRDPIFYANRAACHQALGDYEKVIEDTTAAINLDSSYVKALNRRAGAHEELKQYDEALLDYTASCIVDKFQTAASHQAVERLLEKIARSKGKAIFENKKKRLPSAVFVSNYLQSFRPSAPPAGLEETADVPEESGKGQLKKGIIAVKRRDADGYSEASDAFDKALELGDLGEHEAFAYNMRATFRWLKGDIDDAMEDINRSIELAPSFTQSYVKRASMHLERSTAPLTEPS
jgi:import receptor subunit TOM70